MDDGGAAQPDDTVMSEAASVPPQQHDPAAHQHQPPPMGMENIPATLSHGGRFIQYNIFGNIFEVTAKYKPPIMPIGKGAYGIVWSVPYPCPYVFFKSLLSIFCRCFWFWDCALIDQFRSELRDKRARRDQEDCECVRQQDRCQENSSWDQASPAYGSWKRQWVVNRYIWSVVSFTFYCLLTVYRAQGFSMPSFSSFISKPGRYVIFLDVYA